MAEGRRRPAHIELARSLGVAIVTSQHQPGDLLPSEIDFAESHGVSRSVVREAWRMLAAKGLIESRPKAGTKVRERAAWNLLDPDLLAWMFDGEPSLKFVRNLFELRMIVEPAASELAARGRTHLQLARMGHALETMAAHGLGSAEGQAADQRFHALILEATDNEMIVSLAGSISAAVRWTTFFKYRGSRHPHNPIGEHRVLFEAIADGDADGARAATVALIRQALIDTETAMAPPD